MLGQTGGAPHMKYFQLILLVCLSFTSIACGNRFDLSTERGKQARIDETNFYLSQGDCNSAIDSINPVYEAFPADPEVIVLRASADACFGGFNFIDLLISLTDVSNTYSALALSAPSVSLNDGKLAALYRAVDILTESSTKLSANARGTTVNDFMVFLSMGVIGAILQSYGDPTTTTGDQGTNLDYQLAQAGTMADVDACALVAAHSMAIDSFSFSNLNSNAEAQAAVADFDTACLAATGVTCSNLEKDRTVCDGANAASTDAVGMVGGVNAAW